MRSSKAFLYSKSKLIENFTHLIIILQFVWCTKFKTLERNYIFLYLQKESAFKIIKLKSKIIKVGINNIL